MKKYLLIVMALVVAMVVFNACGAEAPEETSTAPPATETTEAEEVIELKFSSPFMGVDAPTMYGNHLCDLVEEKTNGKVQIERYDSATLAAAVEHLGLLSSGAVDFIVMQMALYPQDLPLNSQANTTQMLGSEESLANIVKVRETPEVKAILEEEQIKNNIKILDYNVSGTSGITTKDPATSMADLQGKKANMIASSQRPVWEEYGVIPVNIQLGEVYEGLSRGIIDAAIGPTAACASMKWFEVAKSHMILDITMVDVPVVVNLEMFEGLPDDVQQAILEASEETMYWSVEYDAGLQEQFYPMFEAAGVDVVHLSQEDSLKFMQIGSSYDRKEAVQNCENLGVKSELEVIYECWDEVYPEAVGDYWSQLQAEAE